MPDSDIRFLIQLEEIIASRILDKSESSYTVQLISAGRGRIAQKLGEEGLELALAAVDPSQQDAIVEEAADLLYHLLVLLSDCDLSLSNVVEALEQRHQTTT